MEKKKEKRELRSPDGTESDTPVADVRVVVGHFEVALRRAEGVGVVAPAGAAQQTARASRGSCGVCHAS